MATQTRTWTESASSGSTRSGTLLRATAVALVGVMGFQVAIAFVRASLERANAAANLSSNVETVVDDAVNSLALCSSRVVHRVTRLRDESPVVRGENDTLDGYWDELVRATRIELDETIVLASAAGELIGVAGHEANQPEALEDRLRAYGIVGRSGSSGSRAGLIDASDSGVFAASVPLAGFALQNDEGESYTDPRIALISPARGVVVGAEGDTVDLDLLPLNEGALPAEYAGATTQLWRSDGHVLERDGDSARAMRAIADPSGRHSFVLIANAQAPRVPLLPPGALERLAWELLAALVAVGLVLRVVKRRLLDPIERLERHASRIARTEHGKLAFHHPDRGEVGVLGRALDAMLHKIDSDRSAWVRSARIAGMSDVSMSVVHSAGNILNSVNVSTKIVKKELSSIGISDLRAMVAELQEHEHDLHRYVAEDANGRFLIPFLAAMTESLCDLQTRCELELEAIDGSIEHVIDLVKSQEKYAIGASLVESVRVEELLDQAISIATLACERAVEIDIERSYSPLGEVKVDRQKLTSVLMNILANAIESVAEDDVHERLVEVATYPMDTERFVVEVTDSGVGIAPEHLDEIFNSSFSTKENSKGLGLHTTANLCKELDIALGVVSDGPGYGATFKLRIPYAPPEDDEDVETPAAALPRSEETPAASR